MRSKFFTCFFLSGAVGLLFSAAAFAADPMLPSTEDFAQRVINVLAWGNFDGQTGESSLVSTLSQWINMAALYLMAVLAVVGGASFVIHTANKGVPGGQVISSFWMPIRICAASILLVPMPSGFSSIQLGVIKIAETGSADANAVSKIGLNYIAENGVLRSPFFVDNTSALLGWVSSEVCRQYINSFQSGNYVQTIKRAQEAPGVVGVEYSYDQIERAESVNASNPRRGYCGKLSISMPQTGVAVPFTGKFVQDPNSAEMIASASIARDFYSLLDALQPRVEKIAALVLSDESAYRELQRSGGSAQSAFESATAQVPARVESAAAEFNSLIAAYDGQLNTIVARAVEKAALQTSGESWRQEITKIGWMGTGTLYWQIANHQERINGLAKTLTAQHSRALLDTHYAGDERLDVLQLRLAGLEKFAKDKPRLGSANIVSIEMAGADGTEDLLKRMMAQIGFYVAKTMLYDGANGDVIMSLAYAGSVLNSIADLSGVAATVAVAGTTSLAETTAFTFNTAAVSASSIPFGGAVLGAGAAAAGSVAVAATSFIANVTREYAGEVKSYLKPLILAGFFLAVVLPTLPLFIWLMGLISWMLFFIECLLVSPFLIAAHGTAEHEGWGSEHTRQGYMLMIGLYLSPILRTIGFFAVYLALAPLGVWVTWLFSYLQGVIVSGWVSPSIIAWTPLLGVIFVYSAAVRIFSLPTELFERGLRWINGGQEVTGDTNAETHNRGLIANFGNNANTMGKGAAAKHSGPTPIAIQPGGPGGNSIGPA